MHPDDKVKVLDIYGHSSTDSKTNAEATLSSLTAEVLRDIARNESNSRVWRKAAVKFLLDRNHVFANMEYLREMVLELKSEKEAELEVQDIVETAAEETLKSEYDKKIAELETEILRLKSLNPKFESSFKNIPKEEVHKLLEE